ncbi:MAG: VIT1/CCC1 transporter family protein [Candidatus Helarchaeota archaeon]
MNSKNNNNEKIEEYLLQTQKNELTVYLIYKKLAKKISKKNSQNKEILEKAAKEELSHYFTWKKYTEKDVKPDHSKIKKFLRFYKIFGLSYTIKKLECDDEYFHNLYEEISKVIPEAEKIIKDEAKHETQLLILIKDERLDYVSSIVLGLNDALVEITGALVGLTFAFNNSILIIITALITGITAALSMSASEYLSVKAAIHETRKIPLKAALYTGITYILTVFLLVLPYLMIPYIYVCLVCSISIGLILIFIITYYTSIIKGVSFKRRFIEMTLICLGIAGISYLIGHFLRVGLNLSI